MNGKVLHGVVGTSIYSWLIKSSGGSNLLLASDMGDGLLLSAQFVRSDTISRYTVSELN